MSLVGIVVLPRTHPIVASAKQMPVRALGRFD